MKIFHDNLVRIIVTEERRDQTDDQHHGSLISKKNFEFILSLEKEFSLLNNSSIPTFNDHVQNYGILKMVSRRRSSSVQSPIKGGKDQIFDKMYSRLFIISNINQLKLENIFKEAFKILSHQETIMRIGIICLLVPIQTFVFFVDHVDFNSFSNHEILLKSLLNGFNVKVINFQYSNSIMTINLHELFSFLIDSRK